VIGHEDGTVCVSDIAPNRGVYAWRGHEEGLRGGAISGTELMTWGAERKVKKWDLREIAQMEPDKTAKLKQKPGKKKQTGVKLAKRADTFFADF
jgi:hypothetical protein